MCAYASASDVAAYCRSLLGSVANFGVSTSPTSIDVEHWLSSGCAVIETNLQAQGYTVPVSSGTVLYGWLSDLNAIYAAAQAEMSRVTGIVQPGARTRGQVFDDMFWKGMSRILNLDLTNTGGGSASTAQARTAAQLYAGGISISDKETNWSNTDNVPPRFYRGQFTFRDRTAASSSD